MNSSESEAKVPLYGVFVSSSLKPVNTQHDVQGFNKSLAHVVRMERQCMSLHRILTFAKLLPCESTSTGANSTSRQKAENATRPSGFWSKQHELTQTTRAKPNGFGLVQGRKEDTRMGHAVARDTNTTDTLALVSARILRTVGYGY